MALNVRFIENATVLPTTQKDKRMVGGVFAPDGTGIEDALLRRGAGAVVRFGQVAGDAPVLHGEYIFGGYVFDHFGHFLLESCQRLWFTRQRPDLPIVWARGAKLAPYQQTILDLLDVRNEHVFVRTPRTVERLHIPETAYVHHVQCSPEMVAFMGCHAGQTVPGRRTWLSRSLLPDDLALIDGEKEIEAALEKAGWLIFHPQLHSIEEQLRVISESEVLSGFCGSAFHMLLLIRSYNGKVIIFSRGKEWMHKDYEMIADVKGLDQTIVTVSVEQVGEHKGYKTSIRVLDTHGVLDTLQRLVPEHISVLPKKGLSGLLSRLGGFRRKGV